MQLTEGPEVSEESVDMPPTSRRTNQTWSVVMIALVVGAVLGFALGGFFYKSQAGGSSSGTQVFNEKEVTSLFEKASPAVVEISVKRGATSVFPDNTGSGFLIDGDGHIVTNNHVVDGAVDISVMLSDGRTIPATRLGSSPADDLAVIRVDPADVLNIAPLALADSAKLKPGQLAIAIGSPFRLQNSISIGVVSGVGQSPSLLRRPIPNMIWTDATLNPGNSGGPLIDSDGEVMGVTSAIQFGRGGEPTIGFAVPSNLITALMPELLKQQEVRRPWLGISGMELTSELSKAVDLPIDEGVYITRVWPGTPAAAAGLRADTLRMPSGRGDVIVAVDGMPVTGVSNLVDYFNRHSPGDEVTLTIFRDSRNQEVRVTLADYLPPST